MTMPASQPVDYISVCRIAAHDYSSYFPGVNKPAEEALTSLATHLTALREAVKEARKFLDIDAREPGAVWPVIPDMMRHRAALVALYRATESLTGGGDAQS